MPWYTTLAGMPFLGMLQQENRSGVTTQTRTEEFNRCMSTATLWLTVMFLQHTAGRPPGQQFLHLLALWQGIDVVVC